MFVTMNAISHQSVTVEGLFRAGGPRDTGEGRFARVRAPQRDNGAPRRASGDALGTRPQGQARFACAHHGTLGGAEPFEPLQAARRRTAPKAGKGTGGAQGIRQLHHKISYPIFHPSPYLL